MSAITFVDSNVLVYANDATPGSKQDQARRRVADLWRAGTAVISVQVLQETYVTITRKLAHPVSPDAARRVVSTYGAWPTHQPDLGLVLDASEVAERNRISFWDAMIVVSARAMGAQILLTEDLRHGQVIEGVRVVAPFLEDADPIPVS